MTGFRDVREFMLACDQRVAVDVYEDNDPKFTRLYLRLIVEEFLELMSSVTMFEKEVEIAVLKDKLFEFCEFGNKVLPFNTRCAIADDLSDIQYVTNGLSNVLGIEMDLVNKEVHDSNMSKLNPGTLKADKDSNGKVIKGSDYFKPDIMGVLKGAIIK